MRSALLVTILACVAALPARADRVVVLGEVLDARARAPIAGVDVRLLVPGGVRAEAATDASGGFVVEAETFSPTLALEAQESTFYEGASFLGVKPGQVVTIYLEPRGPAVAGVLTDQATRRPIPFAPVQLGYGGSVLASALTDAEGRYRIALPDSAPEARATPLDLRLLWVSHSSPDYLPLVRRDLAPDPANPLLVEASLEAMPVYGLLRVECLVAATGSAMRQARVRVGGRLSSGWTERMTDAGGALVLRLPVWERSDLPLEENHLRSDYHVTCRDQRYGFVQATGLTIPPGVSETPGATVVLSLVPSAEAKGAKLSTYSVLLLDPSQPEGYSHLVERGPAPDAPPVEE